jgi:hypothetical protein
MQENRLPIKRTLCYHYGNCSYSLNSFSFLRRIRKISKSGYSFFISVLQSVCSHGTTRLPLDRSSVEFDVRVFFENLSRIFKLYQNVTSIKGTLHEDQYTFLVISCSVLLIMRNVSHRIAEKIKTHDLFSIALLFFENLTVYEIMWENVVEPDTPQMTIWHVCITYWIIFFFRWFIPFVFYDHKY